MKKVSVLLVLLWIFLPTWAQEGTIQHTVTLNEFDYVTITVIASNPSTFDPVVSLLNSNGIILTKNDNHTGDDSQLSPTDSQISDFQIPQTGEYIIEVGPDAQSANFELLISTTERILFDPEETTDAPMEIETVSLGLGRGYIGDWWAVFFNEPSGERDELTYINGIDVPLANAIGQVRNTLDVAAFEMNNEVIVDAILNAHERGVTVRIVTDDEHGMEDDDGVLQRIADAGVPVIDDDRTALMHNKFMIMDSAVVWTGSWNYTINGTYRNNNNAIALQHPDAVAAYQAEFNEMFRDGEFGTTSTDQGIVTFSHGETEVTIIFASEADEVPPLVDVIRTADSNIRIMTFVFSSDELGQAMVDMIDQGVMVQGIFENRNSTADWSELPLLHCDGGEMRQDGNPYTLHHKVFIIDDDTVVTGSFNYSDNALSSNDENVVIIKDKVIAGLYIDEWQRLWDNSELLESDAVICN